MIRESNTAEAQARLAAWWAGEDLGRPALILTALADDADRWPLPEAPASVEARWTDLEYRLAETQAEAERTAWFAEGVPFVYLNLGPNNLPAFLGARRRYQPDTIWLEPMVEDWASFQPHFDPANDWWQFHLEFTRRAAELGQGRWTPTVGVTSCAFDSMSYLRTPEALCLDLLETPEALLRFRDWHLALVRRLYAETVAVAAPQFRGTVDWTGLWAPGWSAALQNDFSCMISPAMFRNQCLPEVREMAGWLEFAVYHLDGPGAIKHLPALLEVEGLRVIQWAEGAGNPPPLHEAWWPLLRQVAEAGRAALVYTGPGEVLAFLRQGVIPCRQLCASVAVGSEAEARAFLTEVERLCAR